MPDRPYLFLELTNSICSTCRRKVEAKILAEDGRVYLHKWCPQHGPQRVLLATDLDYYQLCRRMLKPGQMPVQFNTPQKYGCPYDCGLCPDHEQHSCLTLLEITDHCNLTCPICYAESSPHRPDHRSLAQITFMLDKIVANEREPDVVQISGGEPTTHPDFWAVMDLCKARPIKHLMLNTNGIRIANEPDFARRLADYMPGFEVYLQFDSLHDEPLKVLRGAKLAHIRQRALERLNEYNLSTTLVVTLQKGLNDHEIGEIISFALTQPAVRGVTFQPVQQAGRLEGYDPALHRLTLAEVRSEILRQHPLFAPADIIPVPCHPDCLAMAYALKLGDAVVPLTRMIDPAALLATDSNRIIFERSPELRQMLLSLFSTSASPRGSAATLKQLLCCLPQVAAPPDITYRNIFRIIIMQFLDADNFDVRSVKKTCVHIAHPDGRLIPFDTYNLFYRGKLETTLLPRLRALTGNALE